MASYKNLTIIGTSHIAIESIKEVESTIKKLKPKIVALELDLRRFKALTSNKKRKIKAKDIFSIGLQGWLFNLIGAWAEKKLGEYVGVSPGSEMKQAIISAKKVKAKLALIDQDIMITLRRLSKRITWKEKFRFIKDILKAFIFRKKVKKPFDLTKVPDQKIIKSLIKKVKKNYPNVYLTLIKERNEIIAKNLNKLITDNPKDEIIAIIGAGHEEDIIKLIKKERN